MIDRMFALAIHAELRPRTGRGVPAPRAFIAHITPQPGGPGLPCLEPGLQFDRCVIGKKCRPRPDQLADMIGQRFQQSRAAPHPICECGTVQINLLAGEDFGLPVKRQVIAVFADQHMGEKAGLGATTLNRTRGQWNL